MLRISMKPILAILLWFATAVPAFAQTVTPAQANNLISTLQNDQQRAALIAQLKTLAAVQAPKPAPVVAVAIGQNLLEKATDQLDLVYGQLAGSLTSLNQLPQAMEWVKRLANDPQELRHTGRLIARLLGLLLIAGAAGWVVRLGTNRMLHRIAMRANPALQKSGAPVDSPAPTHGRLWHVLRRMPFALLRLSVELLPVVTFLIAGYLLLGTPLFESHSVRLVSLATIYVLVPARAIWCVVQMLASPDEPNLRLINVSDAGARALVNWIGWLSLVVAAGVAVLSTAGLLGLPQAALSAFGKLLSLGIHIMLVVAVLRSRRAVAQWLRGSEQNAGPVGALRDWMAVLWPYVAIFFVIALWFVWAIDLNEGPQRLLQVGGASLAVLIVSRLLSILGLGLIERATQVTPGFAGRVPGIDHRAQQYAMFARVLFRIILTAASLLVLFQLWGWNVSGWFGANRWGSHVISSSVTILIALALSILVWETANFWFEGQLKHLSTISAMDRLTRLRTIQPMLRSILLVTLVLIAGMTILSEIGVNIAPLLAGAGIAGLAIGFGAQKLVQDVITGLFLLLENAVRVGDAVVAAGLTGTVEHLSPRCLQLRAADGTLHFIPFSSVTSVSNSNRGGLGLAALRFEFEAGTDVSQASALLVRIGKQMREDEAFADSIRGDLTLLGIEEMTGNKIAISAQFPCVPSASGGIVYEYRRLMALEMQDAGIKLAGKPPSLELFTSQPLQTKPVTPKANAPAAAAFPKLPEPDDDAA